MIYENQKHGGEDAIQRTALECQAEEAQRLGPFQPKRAINVAYLHNVVSLPGNPFYNHDPDDEPNTDALAA